MFNEIPSVTMEDIELIGYRPKAWTVSASSTAKKCKNYIRDIVENLDLTPNPAKSVIALSIGWYLCSKFTFTFISLFTRISYKMSESVSVNQRHFRSRK